MVLGVILGIVWLAAGFIIGVVVGNQNKPTTLDVSNSSGLDCDAACAQWKARREEGCRARQEAIDLQAQIDATNKALAAATLVQTVTLTIH